MDRIKRIQVIGLIGFIYSIGLVVDYYMHNQSVFQLVIALCLLSSSIVFITVSNKLQKIQKKSSKK